MFRSTERIEHGSKVIEWERWFSLPSDTKRDRQMRPSSKGQKSGGASTPQTRPTDAPTESLRTCSLEARPAPFKVCKLRSEASRTYTLYHLVSYSQYCHQECKATFNSQPFLTSGLWILRPKTELLDDVRMTCEQRFITSMCWVENTEDPSLVECVKGSHFNARFWCLHS